MHFVARSQPPWQAGETLGTAVAFANAAGAAAVTVVGATPSMPTRSKIERLLESENKIPE